MVLSSLHTSGLAGAPERRWEEIGRRFVLPGGPEGVAAADAVALVHASLDGAACARVLRSRGLASAPGVAEHRGRPSQIDGFDPGVVRAWIADTPERHVRVNATFDLDPPLFGRLRLLAAREPRLAVALGESPTLTLEIGWLFTTDLTMASVDLLRVRVGSSAFATAGSEAPKWLDGLVADLAGRLAELRADPVAAARRLAEAMLSDDPKQRERSQRAGRALEAAPFNLPPIHAVRRPFDHTVAFGPSLMRARQLGPAAARAVALVAAVHLDAPDVLLVPSDPPPPIQDWLASCTEGDGAVLEQVIVLGTA
ncbi:MAG: hypothetical protein ACI8PZ_002307 [Myxococcota bacterium]|jgi:hypothetical protein